MGFCVEVGGLIAFGVDRRGCIWSSYQLLRTTISSIVGQNRNLRDT